MNTRIEPYPQTLPSGGRGYRIGWFLILAVAILIRGGYLAEIEASPELHGPRLDGLYHHYWANAWVTGDWTPPPGEADPEIQSNAYFRPPGYPGFLAVLYRLFGSASLGLRLAQMAAGLATLVCAAGLARRFGGPVAGLAASALLAGFWAPVYYEGCWLEAAPLSLLLFGSAALLYAKRGPVSLVRSLAAGAALGFAGLMRPNAFLLVPVLLLRVASGPRGEARSAWIRAAGFLLLSVGMILFPLARNRIRGGEWVAVSTNAGINLLLGTDRAATVSHGNRMTGDWSCFDAPELTRRVSEAAGRPLRPGEASRELSRMAWEIHRSDPGRALRLAGWKVLAFCAPGEISNNGEEEIDRLTSPILRRLPVSFPLLLGLGAAGFLVWILYGTRDPGGASAGWGNLWVTVVYAGSFIPFVLAGQYRVPLSPFLAVAAGVGIGIVRGLWLERRRREAWLSAVFFVAFTGLALSNPIRVEPDWARWHYMRGQMYARAGQIAREEWEYLAALARDQDRPAVLLNLGILYYERKDPRAETVLQRLQQIRESAQADLYLGRIALDAGNPGRALAHFEASVALDPDSPDGQYRLGLARMELGQPEEALEAFGRAMANAPDFRAARFGQGWALLEAGRPGEAWTVFEEMSREEAALPAVWYQGGKALRALGRIGEAREWWGTYLRMVPDDEAARQEWERLE